MKNKNQSYLAHFGKVFFAAAYVAIISPMAYAASGFSTTTEQKLNNSPNQQLVIESINAEKVATRAEVSALLYKALVSKK